MLAFNHLGRLGYLANQMFQYAAIKGIAAHNGIKYMIPEDREMQLFAGFEMTGVTPHRGFLGPTDPRDERGAPANCHIVKEREFHFDEALFDAPPANASLHGFFQSEKYFADIADAVRRDFTFKADVLAPCRKVMRQFGEKTVSVHLRRGDYLKKPEHHHNLPLEWYAQALSRFPDHQVLVFSDDIRWCKKQGLFKGDRFWFSSAKDGKVVTRDGRWESRNMAHWRDLCLQSLCRDNIISNSTFSWWGAWLNANPDKVVLAPDPATRWFGPAMARLDTRDLMPEGWVLL